MLKEIKLQYLSVKSILLLALIFSLITSCKNSIKKTDGFVCELIKEPQAEISKKQNISGVIPPGYSIVITKEGEAVVYGDLNKDGQRDAVALIEMRGDTSYDQFQEVLLVVFTADRHGQLQMAAATENLGGASLLYSDDGPLLAVKNQVISYHHQSMRHHMVLKFRYEIKDGDFMLIGKDYTDYGGMADGPGKVSINYLTGVKLTNNSTWDDETEEVLELAQVKESFNQPLQSLSTINLDQMYDDLY